jgi:hypothetical protein
MKYLLLIYFLMLPGLSVSAPSDCSVIKDHDRNNLCLAVSSHDASYCLHMKEKDNKNMCLARVKRKKDFCQDIKSKDVKSECQALFR